MTADSTNLPSWLIPGIAVDWSEILNLVVRWGLAREAVGATAGWGFGGLGGMILSVKEMSERQMVKDVHNL